MTYVRKNAFYDAGFDPRFTIDGTGFHDDYAPPNVLKRIYNYICNLFQAMREHFSTTPPFQQLLKKTIKTEFQLGESLQKDRVPQYFWNLKDSYFNGSVSHIFYRDDLFLERTGELFKSLVQEGKCQARSPNLPACVFPEILLIPEYFSNAPQAEYEKRSSLGPNSCNRDISRTSLYGFARLQDPSLARCPDGSLLVDHHTFMDTTAPAANTLKDKTREWRLCLMEADADLKEGKSIEVIKPKIVEKISGFYNAWMDYVDSHKVVSEVYEIVSEKNYQNNYYYDHYFSTPEPWDIIHLVRYFATRLFSLFKAVDPHGAQGALRKEIYTAFVARAEKGAINGKINKSALMYQYMVEQEKKQQT